MRPESPLIVVPGHDNDADYMFVFWIGVDDKVWGPKIWRWVRAEKRGGWESIYAAGDGQVRFDSPLVVAYNGDVFDVFFVRTDGALIHFMR